ncbi:hypothetical protein TWF730_008321 [Orbilia blumenaviensis]|uniref:Uncharacterized protein n=1 Tax=Orbilia blumenaviensis TaxID=1796055 RepID=A0AAV9V388_9PEZI
MSMDADSDSITVAVFTALGTIVGYLGTEVASSSIFDRLLWPTRYNNYNPARPTSLLWIALFMPMGGPIHKAAIEALDKFVANDLWGGRLIGDMLGTAFYGDCGYHYIPHGRHSGAAEGLDKKDARNAFWATVLKLVPWRKLVDKPQVIEGDGNEQQNIRAYCPVFELELTRVTGERKEQPRADVTGDIGPLKLRYVIGILVSEVITIAFGIATAVAWKSPFAAWYFAPLLLKLLALLFHIRREPVQPPSLGKNSNENTVIFQMSAGQNSCFLISGPKDLIYQFCYHYGHPFRNQRAALNHIGDRTREVISMFTTIGFVFVYPAGLIAFIFASADIQWVWLGYQIAAMISMHCYRFFGGEHRGSTQEWLATELGRLGSEWERDPEDVEAVVNNSDFKTPIHFQDSQSGLMVQARLRTRIFEKAGGARAYQKRRIEQFLANESPVGTGNSTGIEGTPSIKSG